MMMSPRLRNWCSARALRGWRDDRAAQIVEFAVALPLLVVFVVGIFDFSGAFTLKQKLTSVARDAARAAAADPANDIAQSSTAVPASVSDAFQVVDNYLIANKINDCGITLPSFVFASPATWKYSASGNGCLGTGLTITINRGFYFPANSASPPPDASCSPRPVGAQTVVVGTCVSIQYAYQWRFGRAVSLLGSTAHLPGRILATAVAMNEN